MSNKYNNFNYNNFKYLKSLFIDDIINNKNIDVQIILYKWVNEFSEIKPKLFKTNLIKNILNNIFDNNYKLIRDNISQDIKLTELYNIKNNLLQSFLTINEIKSNITEEFFNEISENSGSQIQLELVRFANTSIDFLIKLLEKDLSINVLRALSKLKNPEIDKKILLYNNKNEEFNKLKKEIYIENKNKKVFFDFIKQTLFLTPYKIPNDIKKDIINSIDKIELNKIIKEALKKGNINNIKTIINEIDDKTLIDKIIFSLNYVKKQENINKQIKMANFKTTYIGY